MGNIRSIGGNLPPPEEKRGLQLDNAFAQGMEPFITELLYGLGADQNLLSTASQHIRDLCLATDSSPMSRLDVRLVPSNGRGVPGSERVAVFSTQQLKRYQKHIIDKFEQRSSLTNLSKHIAAPVRLGEDTPDLRQAAAVTARELAFEWMFYELCVDALGNSYHMNQTFDGKYVRDFNGQSQGYGTETAISRRYIKEHPEATSLAGSNATTDHAAMRAGIALLLLRDSFIRKGIFDTFEQADEMMRVLAENYPTEYKPDTNGRMIQPRTTPHDEGAIRDRLEAVHQARETDGRIAVAEVVQLVFGKDDE